MKNKKIITMIMLFMIVILNACKKESNTSQSISLEDHKIQSKKVSHESNPKLNNDCSLLLKKLIKSSSIENPFLTTINVEIEKEESQKLILKLYSESDHSKNAIGWIILDYTHKKLLDITNDPEEPIDLRYNNMLWEKVSKCYFNKESNITLKSNCKEILTEDGAKEECVFEKKDLETIYKNIINNQEVENYNFLLKQLPLKNVTENINQNGLLSINYLISENKIIITFQYEGGSTEIQLEKQNSDIKKTTIHSAD